MTLTAQTTLELTTADGRRLGSFAFEEYYCGAACGTFTPGPDYPSVEPLFRYFEELADGQVLSLIDEAAAAIEQLDIRAVGPEGVPTPVTAMRIYYTREASFRLRPTADQNGHTPHA